MINDHLRPLNDSLDVLPSDLAERVRGELDSTERVFWVGQPRPDLFASGSGCAVLMGVFVAVFSLFWMAVPITMGAFAAVAGAGGDQPVGGLLGTPFFCFSLFGIPFLVLGCLMATSPFWRRRQAHRTCYVVTNRRALTLDAGTYRGLLVRSFGPQLLQNMERVERPDGGGSLIFQQALEPIGDGVRTQRLGFIGIEQVASVERLIRDKLLRTE